jgi:hypothetical protein
MNESSGLLTTSQVHSIYLSLLQHKTTLSQNISKLYKHLSHWRPVLLWGMAGSLAAHGKITVRGLANRLNFSVIFKLCM